MLPPMLPYLQYVDYHLLLSTYKSNLKPMAMHFLLL